jgi:hypothetical protein
LQRAPGKEASSVLGEIWEKPPSPLTDVNEGGRGIDYYVQPSHNYEGHMSQDEAGLRRRYLFFFAKFKLSKKGNRKISSL